MQKLEGLEFLDKCNLKDLVEFRKSKLYIDKDKRIRNSVRIQDLVFIAKNNLGYSAKDIQIAFVISNPTVYAHIYFVTINNRLDRISRVSEKLNEWKFNQLK